MFCEAPALILKDYIAQTLFEIYEKTSGRIQRPDM